MHESCGASLLIAHAAKLNHDKARQASNAKASFFGAHAEYLQRALEARVSDGFGMLRALQSCSLMLGVFFISQQRYKNKDLLVHACSFH